MWLEFRRVLFRSSTTKAAWFTCSCQQCRIDTMCYVLNKLQPKYIASSRGVAYTQRETLSDQQVSVDIDKIIIDGMKQVLSAKRPHFSSSSKENLKNEAYFNFPTIIGKVLNGTTFEPIYDINVELLNKKKPIQMMDESWHNPYKIVSYTPGTYTFWPHSMPSDKKGESCLIQLEIKITVPNFETISHFFDLQLKSETINNSTFNAENVYKIQDLYLFPTETSLIDE